MVLMITLNKGRDSERDIDAEKILSLIPCNTSGATTVLYMGRPDEQHYETPKTNKFIVCDSSDNIRRLILEAKRAEAAYLNKPNIGEPASRLPFPVPPLP